MLEFPTTASAATCAAFAQILPVFMVALVAERVARSKEPADSSARARLRLATLVRILFDLMLTAVLLFLTFAALDGIESDGVDGEHAALLWGGTFIIGLAILYRWLLLSTPILSLLTELGEAWARVVTRALDWLLSAVPEGWDFLVDTFGRILQVLSEVVFGLLSAGLFRGLPKLSDWFAPRVTITIEIGPSKTEADRKKSPGEE